jgi:NDP-sugar pyrophosphorylase family protein
MNTKTIGIIFAAGKGTRLQPLTLTTPKPLLSIDADKSLLMYNMEMIEPLVDSFVVIVSYLKEQIIESIGPVFKDKTVEFVTQLDPKGGTLDALRAGVYHSSFVDLEVNYIVSNADDIMGVGIYQELQKAINLKPDQGYIVAMVVDDKEKLKSFGVLKTDSNNMLQEMYEKPQEYISSYVNIGLYYFPFTAKSMITKTKTLPSDQEDFITTNLVLPYAQKYGIKVIPALDTWWPVTSVDDLYKVRLQFSDKKSLEGP